MNLKNSKYIIFLALPMIFVFILFEINAFALENQEFEYKINDADSKQTISVIDYLSQSENVIIPSKIDDYEVTEVASNCFSQNKTIKSVQIPDTVISIGNFAFSDCINLKNISLGESVAEILKYSFSGCESILSINLPESVNIIDDYAFSGDISLKYIKLGDNITKIGENAFYNCDEVVFYCNEDTKTYKTLSSYLKKYPISNYSISDIESQTETQIQTTENVFETSDESNNTDIETTTTTTTTKKTTSESKTTKKTTTTKVSESALFGDYNLDGVINSSDAVESLKYYANSLVGKKYNLICTFENADVSEDGKINSTDAVIILKYFAQQMLGYSYNLKTYISR